VAVRVFARTSLGIPKHEEMEKLAQLLLKESVYELLQSLRKDPEVYRRKSDVAFRDTLIKLCECGIVQESGYGTRKHYHINDVKLQEAIEYIRKGLERYTTC
jgi:hypothetical protein